MTHDLQHIAKTAIHYRDSKFFAPTTWETFPHRLSALTVEVGELVDAIEQRRTSPMAWRALRYELADCAMLALQMLEDLWPGAWCVRERYHGGKRVDSPAEVLVSPLRKHLDGAARSWWSGNKRDAQIALELFVCALCDLRAKLVTGSLVTDVDSKVASMAERPARHGRDKRC